MSNLLYDWLSALGYSHPLHPVLVHIPAGATIGAFCFACWASLTRNPLYRNTAYQLCCLALIFTFLAIPVGIMDWQRFFGGAWLNEINMKLVLACCYTLVLLATVYLGLRYRDSLMMNLLYALGVVNVAGLGFFGGQLVYSGYTPEAPERFAAGQRIFEGHCSGCHRRGENIIVPSLPLRHAPQLKDFAEFLPFIRHPRMPDGSTGLMPEFSPDNISDTQAKELFDYLHFEFVVRNSANR